MDGVEAPKAVDEMTFKEASKELEMIVRALEKGDLELEESLERYARGVELLASQRERLAQAEQRVQVLVEQAEMPAQTIDTTSAPSTAFIGE